MRLNTANWFVNEIFLKKNPGLFKPLICDCQFTEKLQEKMTNISLIQARDDGHLEDRQQLLEKQRKGLSNCWQEGPRKLSQDLWGLAPKHSRTLASCSAWEPRAPQLGLILPQPCSEQECFVNEAGRSGALTWQAESERRGGFYFMVARSKVEKICWCSSIGHIPHGQTRLIVRFWHLLWNVLMSGRCSYGYCTFNPHSIKIQSPGWTAAAIFKFFSLVLSWQIIIHI